MEALPLPGGGGSSSSAALAERLCESVLEVEYSWAKADSNAQKVTAACSSETPMMRQTKR